MDIAAIQGRLNELFSVDPDVLAERGRVVVWFDPKGEFSETLAELDLPDVEVLAEEPNHLFELKRRLNEPLGGRKVLLYRQRPRGQSREELRTNWLADVELFAEPFQADYTSLLLAELGATDAPAMRAAVEGGRRFFAKRGNLKRLRALRTSFERPQELQLAVMTVVLGGVEQADALHVLLAYLLACRTEEPSDVVDRLCSAGVGEAFCALVRQLAGYAGDVRDVTQLQCHVLLTALGRTLDLGYLRGLEQLVSQAHGQACLNLVHAWSGADAQAFGQLYEVCREVEATYSLPACFEAVRLSDLRETDVFPAIDEAILRRYLRHAVDPASDLGEVASEVSEMAAHRCNLMWYERVAAYYEALTSLAQMQRFAHDHLDGFDRPGAVEMWQEYVGEWHRMDMAYRRFHTARMRAVKRPVIGLDDDLKAAADAAERLYKDWFLVELGAAWDRATEADRATCGYVEGIPRQGHFALSELPPLLKASTRAYVIISDGLRFEVAHDLADALEAQTRGRVELGAMQSVFPSETAFGMAALLPHGSYRVDVAGAGQIEVSLDGRPAVTTGQRQEVLRQQYEGAIAVRYDDFIAMRSTQRRELVADAKVVYIYHDCIDATGEKRATEDDVFQACDQTVDELAGLIGTIIVRELKGSSVVVTADHGFLYTYEPLREIDKVGADDVEGDVIERSRRYTLARAGATSHALTPVAMASNGASDLVGFVPRGALRMKVPGGVQNYMHGGLSLQESCVPVLRFKNYRAGSKGYVETEPAQIELITSSDRISNNLFDLSFFQKEPVGGKVVEADYELFMADAALRPVSDTHRLRAQSTSTERAERQTAVRFAMLAGAKTSPHETYYLVAVDKSTGQVVWKRPFCIDITFADDFGW